MQKRIESEKLRGMNYALHELEEMPRLSFHGENDE
jgi:hypothetical protein